MVEMYAICLINFLLHFYLRKFIRSFDLPLLRITKVVSESLHFRKILKIHEKKVGAV